MHAALSRWTLCLAALMGGASCAATEPPADAASGAVAGRDGNESDPRYTVDIRGGALTADDGARLRSAIGRAIDAYERAFGKAPGEPVAVAVDPGECLRTGYDHTRKRVAFCNVKNTPASGTASVDVIHHEMFHALFCRARPDTCTKEKFADVGVTALHEALADFFAYTVVPDRLFGEGFYSDRPAVRSYRTTHCHSLVDGAHEKGNTMASALIAQGRRLEDLRPLIAGAELSLSTFIALVGQGDACFTDAGPRMGLSFDGASESSLSRYRIARDRSLGVRFVPNEVLATLHPDLSVRWSPAPSLFTIAPSGPLAFVVTATGERGFDKVEAIYEAGGVPIGTKTFYFQIDRDP